MDNLHPQIHPVRRATGRPRPARRAGGRRRHRPRDVGRRCSPTSRPTSSCTSRPRRGPASRWRSPRGTRRSTSSARRRCSTRSCATAPCPRRIVLTSSRAVYGEGAWRRRGRPLFYPAQRTTADPRGRRSGTSPEPSRVRDGRRTVFAGAGERLRRHQARAGAHPHGRGAQSRGVEPVVLRLQNVYGPGQSLINPYTGIMSLFCRMAKAGRSIPLYEDGAGRAATSCSSTTSRVRCTLAATVAGGARRARRHRLGGGPDDRHGGRADRRATTAPPRRTSPGSSARATCATRGRTSPRGEHARLDPGARPARGDRTPGRVDRHAAAAAPALTRSAPARGQTAPAVSSGPRACRAAGRSAARPGSGGCPTNSPSTWILSAAGSASGTSASR